MLNKENNNLPFIIDITWDFKRPYSLDEKYIFYLVEKRWRYIDQNKLSEEEKNYIAHLVDKYGKGVLIV